MLSTFRLFRTAATPLPTLDSLKSLIRAGQFLSALPGLKRVDLRHADYNGLLHFAVGMGARETIRYLLYHGVDINQRHTSMADLLKTPGQGPTAAYIAAMSGQHAALELLLDKGANPNLSCTFLPGDIYHQNVVPLHQAAVQGDIKLGELLLKYNAEVNPRSKAGETPLLHTCWKGHEHMMCFLLRNGADPIIPSTVREGVTSLSFIEDNNALKMRYEAHLAESASLKLS